MPAAVDRVQTFQAASAAAAAAGLCTKMQLTPRRQQRRHAQSAAVNLPRPLNFSDMFWCSIRTPDGTSQLRSCGAPHSRGERPHRTSLPSPGCALRPDSPAALCKSTPAEVTDDQNGSDRGSSKQGQFLKCCRPDQRLSRSASARIRSDVQTAIMSLGCHSHVCLEKSLLCGLSALCSPDIETPHLQDVVNVYIWCVCKGPS